MKSLKKILLFFFILTAFQGLVYSQATLISGTVKDSLTGELLAGAAVIEANSNNASSTNQYGFFTLRPKTNSPSLIISYVGYITKTVTFFSLEDTLLSIPLVSSNKLSEVIIFGNKPLQSVSSSSELSIPLNLTKELPSFMGEPDILKAIQHFPGVQSGVEGTSGIHVRGGSPDQNLILIDEVPVYNVGHLMGFFSVFNTDALRSTTFIKGGLPARYGGRLSSVIDVKMKEGNLNNFSLRGNIGLLSSQITVEAPILKSKLGFMLAARRTYYDLFFSPILRLTTNTTAGYHFYDINGSINYRIDSKNSIYYSLYNGKDKGHVAPDTRVTFAENNQLSWGNNIHSIRWNHVFNNGVFSNLTLAYSGYNYRNSRSFINTLSSSLLPEIIEENEYTAAINDLIMKYSFEQSMLKNHQLRYGIEFISHFYKPGQTSLFSSKQQIDTLILARKIRANELAAYIEDEITTSEKFTLSLGVRTSLFSVDDTTYYSFEPRIGLLLKTGERGALKASYTRATQYIGLLTSTSVGLPTDLWIPSTQYIPPQRSDLFVLGYHYNLKWANFTSEIFYKEMKGLVEFREGASFMLGRENWDELIAVGHGEAYGIEILAEKNLGKIKGWISYTLSKNQRHFPEIDLSFPYKYDRRHNLTLTGKYNFNVNKSLSATWIYYSGENITLSEIRHLSYPALANAMYLPNQVLPGLSTVEVFTERNNFQMEPYHRLDLGYSVDKKKGNKFVTWRFGIYNAYSRKNTFFALMLENDDDEIYLAKYSFTPIMPYIRYEVKF
jgi:hypothetical protein